MWLSVILLIAWLISPIIAYLISKDDNVQAERLEGKDLLELRKIARKTWRYFEEFANLKNNYLAPDNFQEEPYRGIAYKTSPTNIGLGLMASLTARDMGYIGLIETSERISRTITTIEKMAKWNGHLYNWYDTRTLEPLKPMYVSTVDSGNLVCYLTTLTQGLKEYLKKPLIDDAFARGIIDTVRSGLEEDQELPVSLMSISSFEGQEKIEPMLWNKALKEFVENSVLSSITRKEWQLKSEHLGNALKQEIVTFMPWVKINTINSDQPLNIELKAKLDYLIELMRTNATLKELPVLSRNIKIHCDQLTEGMMKTGSETFVVELAWLIEVKEAA